MDSQNRFSTLVRSLQEKQSTPTQNVPESIRQKYFQEIKANPRPADFAKQEFLQRNPNRPISVATPYGLVQTFVSDDKWIRYKTAEPEEKLAFLKAIQDRVIAQAESDKRPPVVALQATRNLYAKANPTTVKEKTLDLLKQGEDIAFQYVPSGNNLRAGMAALEKLATEYAQRSESFPAKFGGNLAASVLNEARYPVSNFINKTSPLYDPESTWMDKGEALGNIVLYGSQYLGPLKGMEAARDTLNASAKINPAAVNAARKAFGKADSNIPNIINIAQNAPEAIEQSKTKNKQPISKTKTKFP
jgi:hypothetical protein